MSSVAPRAALDAVRPYGDHLDDGLVQLSFTLPVDHGPLAREAALALVRDRWGSSSRRSCTRRR